MTHFGDRLIAATRNYGPLCVGIDPHKGRIPALFGGDTPAGVAAWGMAVVQAVAGRAGIVKPQVGLFERHGPEGMAALQLVSATAREAGLLVIMDAKRGDIGSTAEGYAEAYLSTDAPFVCDALTVNPYMGVETIEPYTRRAVLNGKGVIVLARTSNPGAADFQARDMGGAPLYARVVEALAPMIAEMQGETGWSSLMLVTGATGPDEARALRALAPHAPFLVPGYGTQGAGAAEALAGFVAGKMGLEGGTVNASRSVTFPMKAQAARTLEDWEDAVIAAIDTAVLDLKSAASGG